MSACEKIPPSLEQLGNAGAPTFAGIAPASSPAGAERCYLYCGSLTKTVPRDESTGVAGGRTEKSSLLVFHGYQA